MTAARHGERTVLTVVGEMDVATAPRFAASVREHLADGPVLVDLRSLSFMDSSGVRELDTLARDADTEAQSFAISSDLHPNVRRVLQLTGMLDALPLQDPSPAGGDNR